MTTPKAKFTMNPGGVEAIFAHPEVRAATARMADQVMENMKAVWPEHLTLTKDIVDDVFTRTSDTMADGRPAEWVLINHPDAMAREARTGFITKAIAAAGAKVKR